MLKMYERNGVLCAEGLIETIGQKVFLYMVDGLLIDSGPEKLREELLSLFQENDFDQLVLTHNHEDHTGNAAWIQNNLAKPIFIHPQGLSECLGAGDYPNYRRITWGGREAFSPQPVSAAIQSRNLKWRILHTPGHTDDHIALYNEERKLLFTGDLYVAARTKVSMKTESVPKIMSSIRLLLDNEFTAIYCSHAGYLENGRELLEQKLRYLEAISVKATALAAGGESAQQIADTLLPGNYPIIRFSEKEWDTVHLIRSILDEPLF
ncbi:MBL fold metallo-hydrolase [Planococcus salinarum]|uniref:MBL fold metallo-hydrolase n=1 Tax=Planococcus salinarum TaxID=622695 RepID=UPI00163D45EA|nr:MBL fold metallo-hydrolase [Planococcus salinarum]